MRLRTLVALSLTCLAALVPATGAEAKAPPSGKYDCTIGAGSELMGTLTVDGSRYKLNRSKWGKFEASGKKLTFKSGIWKKLFKGRWYRTTDKNNPVEIALTSLASGFETAYCDKRR